MKRARFLRISQVQVFPYSFNKMKGKFTPESILLSALLGITSVILLAVINSSPTDNANIVAPAVQQLQNVAAAPAVVIDHQHLINLMNMINQAELTASQASVLNHHVLINLYNLPTMTQMQSLIDLVSGINLPDEQWGEIFSYLRNFPRGGGPGGPAAGIAG